MNLPFIIIGASAAGVAAAMRLRQLSTDPIILISHEHELPYNKCLLTNYLGDPAQKTKLYLKPTEWFAENNIKLLLDTKVVAIDSIEQSIEATTGDNNFLLSYKALLIASGSQAKMPQAWQELVVPFHNLVDVATILKQIKDRKNVVIIGAGINGIECAQQFKKKNLEVIIFEQAPTILPHWPVPVSNFLEQKIDKQSIKIFTDTHITSIEKHHEQFLLHTSKGMHEADIVIGAMGVKPATDFVPNHFKKDNFVLINNFMQTVWPTVFAAGDCCLVNDQQPHDKSFHWQTAVAQGIVAAHNMAQAHSKKYSLTAPLGQTIIGSDSVFWAGSFEPGQELFESDEKSFVYQSFNAHKLTGFITYGEPLERVKVLYQKLTLTK